MGILLIIEIFLKASILVQFIMVVLVILSIWSWTLIINRLIRLSKIHRRDAEFNRAYTSGTGFTLLSKQVNEQKNPVGLARIFKQGVLAYSQSKTFKFQTPEAVTELINKKMSTTISEEIDSQDFGMNILSIVTGVSPYIGLFGTVWGIIEVFTGLGQAQQVNIQTIAPGISEALIATSMGLFCAIPALIAYNIFNRQIHYNETAYYNFQDTFISIIQEDIHRRLNETHRQLQMQQAGE